MNKSFCSILRFFSTGFVVLGATLLGAAQTTQLGARLGAGFWSRPAFKYGGELLESSPVAPQSEVFLRRQGHSRWVKEWSIGATQYHQKARFPIFDGPDEGEFDVTLIEPSFSLFRDLSPRRISSLGLRTYLGLTASLGASRIRARWVGFSDGVGEVDGTRHYWTYGSLYAGPVVANSLSLGKGCSLESLIAYRLTYSSIEYGRVPMPPHRVSWTLGVSASL